MAENKDINTLRANPKNPRQISTHDFDALVNAIKKFGDLSGIVFNIRTQQLVGGHQRIEAFKRLGGQPIIIERLAGPNSKGTVATGYVLLDDEKYTYREVDWDEGKEAAANIAANRIQGQFDLDVLSEVIYDISQLEDSASLLESTGQTNKEIEHLLKMVGVGVDDDSSDDGGGEDFAASKPGKTYLLGGHRLLCGELEPIYCDTIRKNYAKHIGRASDWQAATPAVMEQAEPTS